MEELFFFPSFFPFQPRENRSGDLRWPWRGVPKSLVPTVLSRAVHSFCCLHSRGRARGLHLIVCRPLPPRCQSHDRVLPPSLLLHQALPAGILLQSSPRTPWVIR